MFKVYISVVLAMLVCISPSLARGVIIMDEIWDAGIYCPTSSPAIDGFYSMVEKKCKGKSSCRVRATMVTTKQDLLRHRCTGFFVAPLCRGTPVNVESRYDVFKTLLVSCK
ncbi:hypothetical protein V1290_002864 [Bradyrhizobium sp. AZCC 1578]|uniref:hypothetical protein n=1 Tax=Bradyrhizobium sp. AZCC 1578 TaxID=3117027 RepID=UPI002FF1A0AF